MHTAAVLFRACGFGLVASPRWRLCEGGCPFSQLCPRSGSTCGMSGRGGDGSPLPASPFPPRQGRQKAVWPAASRRQRGKGEWPGLEAGWGCHQGSRQRPGRDRKTFHRAALDRQPSTVLPRQGVGVWDCRGVLRAVGGPACLGPSPAVGFTDADLMRGLPCVRGLQLDGMHVLLPPKAQVQSPAAQASPVSSWSTACPRLGLCGRPVTALVFSRDLCSEGSVWNPQRGQR